MAKKQSKKQGSKKSASVRQGKSTGKLEARPSKRSAATEKAARDKRAQKGSKGPQQSATPLADQKERNGRENGKAITEQPQRKGKTQLIAEAKAATSAQPSATELRMRFEAYKEKAKEQHIAVMSFADWQIEGMPTGADDHVKKVSGKGKKGASKNAVDTQATEGQQQPQATPEPPKGAKAQALDTARQVAQEKVKKTFIINLPEGIDDESKAQGVIQGLKDEGLQRLEYDLAWLQGETARDDRLIDAIWYLVTVELEARKLKTLQVKS